VVILDSHLQKEEAGALTAPRYRPPAIAGLDEGKAREVAEALLKANNPRIEVGFFRTHDGVAAAIQLAELVGASVGSRAHLGPMSFPQGHPLSGPGEGKPDFTLGLETGPADMAIVGPRVADLTPVRDTVGIGFGGLRANAPALIMERQKANLERMYRGKLPLASDAEASLPAIIAQVRKALTAAQRRTIEARAKRHANANQAAFLSGLEAAMEGKLKGWNSSPVSTARIYAELWPLIANEDWCLASPTTYSSSHNRDLWVHNRPYSYLGAHPAAAIGYGAGAAGGAGLAARGRGRIVVNIQTDGDLNFQPGVLWSAAHYKLPVLTVMHNNQAWHQELMYQVYICGIRGRGTERAQIGTALRDPFIDYAKMAAAYGMKSEGPISDPNALAPALKRGIAAVKNGEPYLIDVLTQPR
jgi:thiamine pyrophosphate-dependent acetolactate synthase large subunit-like protein